MQSRSLGPWQQSTGDLPREHIILPIDDILRTRMPEPARLRARLPRLHLCALIMRPYGSAWHTQPLRLRHPRIHKCAPL